MTKINTQTGTDMIYGREQDHTVVELVGGPLDGRRLVEQEGGKFSHNPESVYGISGNAYTPWKVVSGVLYLRYRGKMT